MDAVDGAAPDTQCNEAIQVQEQPSYASMDEIASEDTGLDLWLSE